MFASPKNAGIACWTIRFCSVFIKALWILNCAEPLVAKRIRNPACHCHRLGLGPKMRGNSQNHRETISFAWFCGGNQLWITLGYFQPANPQHCCFSKLPQSAKSDRAPGVRCSRKIGSKEATEAICKQQKNMVNDKPYTWLTMVISSLE